MDAQREFVTCLSSADIKSQDPPPFLAGHDTEMKATAQFLEFLSSKERAWTVMAFGWPGTGKTVFPAALAYRLNQTGIACGLAHIPCQRLTAELSVGEVRQHLEKLNGFVNQSQEPKLIIFDELDAFAPTRASNPSLLQLTTWAMDFFDIENSRLKRGLIGGVTNNPAEVDFAVRDRLASTLYFKLPTRGMVTEILAHTGVPRAGEVTIELFELLTGRSELITGRGAYEAAKLAVDFYNNAIETESPKEIARFMHVHSNTVLAREVETYREKHLGLIDKSTEFVKSWEGRAVAKTGN